MVVAMGAGDTLEIVDPEGRQPGELTVFGPAGVNDCGLLSARSTGPSSAMADIVSNAAEDARAVASALRRRGIDAKNAEVVHVFGSESGPGERVTFTAEQESLCIVAALGGPMRVDEQNPPTDLIAFVRRASASNIEMPPLPEPLAEPRLDIRVDRCTARAYQVKAGEYIQIIDVEGRECTDFQAFTAAALDQGIERGLDPTTTRTLRRRRLRRYLAAATGGGARPAGVGEVLHGAAAQCRGAGAEKPQDSRANNLDATGAAVDGRARLVSIQHRPHRRL